MLISPQIKEFRLPIRIGDGRKLWVTHAIVGFRESLVLLVDPFRSLHFPAYYIETTGELQSIDEAELLPIREFLSGVFLDTSHIGLEIPPTLDFLKLEEIPPVSVQEIALPMDLDGDGRLFATHIIHDLFSEKVLIVGDFTSDQISINPYFLTENTELGLSTAEAELLSDYLEIIQIKFDHVEGL